MQSAPLSSTRLQGRESRPAELRPNGGGGRYTNKARIMPPTPYCVLDTVHKPHNKRHGRAPDGPPGGCKRLGDGSPWQGGISYPCEERVLRRMLRMLQNGRPLRVQALRYGHLHLMSSRTTVCQMLPWSCSQQDRDRPRRGVRCSTPAVEATSQRDSSSTQGRDPPS